MRFIGGVLICLGLVSLFGCAKKADSTVSSTALGSSAPASEPAVAEKVTYTDPVVGKGEPVASGDTVWVQYKGTLKNGTVFDENSGDADPFTFTLGQGPVIKGWDQGLLGMRVGGERKLHVPSSLGYGPNGQPPKIPANADLDFDIKLLGLVKVGEENVIDKTDLKTGTGRAAKTGDKVTIHYVGTLLNGKVFEDSNTYHQAYSFTIGAGQTLPCIDKGVQGMKVGGKRRIVAPPQVAYVGRALAGVPPNSEVVFTVDLLSIK
ncbi:MAG TPA: FKBP-type peptidyl-prolyl cis-trans isomerase [Fimbriimonadaceae bacterium]|nr:FKBP-type peptidyl-prolyl cis-trans isomerase [Fimbriimonadaceae bacterium]